MKRAKETAEIGCELKRILDENSTEKLMIFTERSETKELCAQINRLLEDRQQLKAEFKQRELSIAQMISNISHDIRTPMTVILGYLEMLQLQKDKRQGPDEVSTENVWDMIGNVEKKAVQVMELMEQFFTLSRLEAGEEQLTFHQLDLGEACRECVLDFYEILTERQFQVEISIPEEKLMISGNDAALRRILFNLLSNVLRYGKDGKYLGFFVKKEQEFIYVQVKDKGKGIEPKFLPHIFDRLYMAEAADDQKTYGNGLGLSIAKRLAKHMEGELSVSSSPYVETCFILKFPVASETISDRNS
ncbi:MAG: HAMP domain-containing histidine kinase [Lachnospiraceae bacterium]|nr:HAMP domain-containing histidine kinase [Lachnospiraceae bacterium]